MFALDTRSPTSPTNHDALRPAFPRPSLSDAALVMQGYWLLLPPALIIAGLCIGPSFDDALRPALHAYLYAPLALTVAMYGLAPLAAYIESRRAAPRAARADQPESAPQTAAPSAAPTTAPTTDQQSPGSVASVMQAVKAWPRYQQFLFAIGGVAFLRVLYLIQHAAGNIDDPPFPDSPAGLQIMFSLWLALAVPPFSRARVSKASSPTFLAFGAILFLTALAQLLFLRRYGTPALDQIERIAFIANRSIWLVLLSMVYWIALAIPVSLITSRRDSATPPPPPTPEQPHHPEPRTGVP